MIAILLSSSRRTRKSLTLRPIRRTGVQHKWSPISEPNDTAKIVTNQGMNSDIYGRLALDICTVFMMLISSLRVVVNLVANSLGLLVRIVTVSLLQLLDQLDVFGLGIGGGDALVDNLLPGVLLGLALLIAAVSFGLGGGRRRE